MRKKIAVLFLSCLLLFQLVVLFQVYPVKADSTTKTVVINSQNYDGSLIYFSSNYTETRTALNAISSQTNYIDVGQAFLSATHWYYIYRSFLYFDTSIIPDAAEISAATLSLYVSADYSTTDFLVTIQNGQPTYPHIPLENGDYYYLYYSGNGGSRSTSDGLVVGSYWNITLNSNGLSWIKKDGYTKLCLRSNRDINGNAPTGSEYVIFNAIEGGLAYAPKLYVTYEEKTTYYFNINGNLNTEISGTLEGRYITGSLPFSVGFRVFIVRSGYEYELTNGSVSAVITRYSPGVGFQTSYLVVPTVSLLSSVDRLRVSVYMRNRDSGWIFTGNYTTSPLPYSTLKSSTWKFYIYTDATYSRFYVVYGVAQYASCIQNVIFSKSIPRLMLPFDDELNATCVDWSAHANHGTLTGAERVYEGYYGMALSFGGTSYVSIVDDVSLDFTTSIAISARVYVTDLSKDNQIIVDKPNSYGLYVFANGKIGLRLNDDLFNTSTNVISKGTWHLITAAYLDQDSVVIYVDGLLKHNSPYSESITISAFDVVIGYGFYGYLDEIMLMDVYEYRFCLSPIASFPYAYNIETDTTACSWVVATLNYNFTAFYVQQDVSHPITYARLTFSSGGAEIGIAYNVTSGTWTKYGENQADFIAYSYSTSGNVFILELIVRINEYASSQVNVDVYLYCRANEYAGTKTFEDEFSIYGLGGLTQYIFKGDGFAIAGGSVLDVAAAKAGSSAFAGTIIPNLQHVHLLVHLYQSASWDGSNGVWDCPTYHHNTGYYEFGVDYMLSNCTWLGGWYVHIEVDDGAAGTGAFLENDQAWVKLNLTWHSNGKAIKSDVIYAMYEAYTENDVTTQFSLYIDLWISNSEQSSRVGGHVSAMYYGMKQIGWWLWANWGPIGGLATQSTFYDYLYDENGTVITAANLKILRVWAEVGKTNSECDDHTWAIICETFQTEYLPYNLDLHGITTPVFMPTTTPDMPLGFFASLGTIISRGLTRIYTAIATLTSSAAAITSGVLDATFETFGVKDFTATISSYISGLGVYFGTSVNWILNLIGSFFKILANIGLMIIDWFGRIVNTFIRIGSIFYDIITGASSVTEGLGNLIETFLPTNAEFWTVLVPLIVIISWWQSIDQRAKKYGGGWVTIFLSDINMLLNILSFILDLAWRVVNAVIDLVSRFINIFIPIRG